MPGLLVEKPTFAGGAHEDVVFVEPQPVDTPASPGKATVASTPSCVDDDPASDSDPWVPEVVPDAAEPEADPELDEPDPPPDVEPVPAAVPVLAPVPLFEPEPPVEPELAFAPEASPETFAPPGLDAPEQAVTNETAIENPRIALTRMRRSMRVRDAACQAISKAAEGNLRTTESCVPVKSDYRNSGLGLSKYRHTPSCTQAVSLSLARSEFRPPPESSFLCSGWDIAKSNGRSQRVLCRRNA